MTSVLNVDTIADKAGTGPVELTKQSAAKVWTNLNMSTGTYRDSFNIASATDNGTGDFTNNYTSAMANANYNHEYTQFENGRTGGYLLSNYGTYVTASLMRGRARESGGALNDSDYVGLTVHGDLA